MVAALRHAHVHHDDLHHSSRKLVRCAPHNTQRHAGRAAKQRGSEGPWGWTDQISSRGIGKGADLAQFSGTGCTQAGRSLTGEPQGGLWLEPCTDGVLAQACVTRHSVPAEPALTCIMSYDQSGHLYMQEWPDLVHASVERFTERETAALQQLRSNVAEWADEVPETMPGDSNTSTALGASFWE